MTRSWISVLAFPKLIFCPERYFFIGTFSNAMNSILELLDITPRSVWGFVSGDLVYTICLALLYYETNPSLNYQDFTYQWAQMH